MLYTTMVTNEQHCMEILNIFDRISINFFKNLLCIFQADIHLFILQPWRLLQERQTVWKQENLQ